MVKITSLKCDRCGYETKLTNIEFGTNEVSCFSYHTKTGSWIYDICLECSTAIHNYIEKSTTAQPQMITEAHGKGMG